VPTQADSLSPATPAEAPGPTAMIGTGDGGPIGTGDGGLVRWPTALAAVGRHRGQPRRPFPRGASWRTLGICGWGTGLGAVGLGSALRGLPAILADTAPAWYQPTLSTLGLSGIGLATAAFLSIQRRRLPWLMLGLATVPLGVNLGLTIATV
jgi:hypothetical protein